jgi:hypothetical protein
MTTLQDLERTVELLGEVYHETPGIVFNNFDPKRAYGIVAPASAYRHHQYIDSYLNYQGNGGRRSTTRTPR